MSRAKLLALYLPQFHPIPENDAWWGPGFTEWTNVVRARPLFREHYQPHLPADLGFYDLRLPESREAQASLAEAYGISGFCYYHYWFNGKRLLHRPFDEVLLSGRPKLSFCLCWANENWTRRWDGYDAEVLLAQTHSDEDDARHAEHLLHAFRDDRYIKINGRPLFLVYRTALLRNAERTARIWRDKVRAAGFPDLYLVRVESWGDYTAPQAIGFDAAVEFAPEFVPSSTRYGGFSGIRRRIRNRLVRYRGNHQIFEYESLIEHMLAKPKVDYTRFPCVIPGWDNSPRRREGAAIFVGSTPHVYENWLRTVAARTSALASDTEAFIFINAWNEWAEGNHLEPDQRWGRAYLEATARALR